MASEPSSHLSVALKNGLLGDRLKKPLMEWEAAKSGRAGSLSSEVIWKVLRKVGVVNNPRGLYLDLIPRNIERLDYYEKASFRVFGGKRTLCHLTIGRDLADLNRRTSAFAKACPDIACQPMFWHRQGQWDFLGVEYFDGDNLEEATVFKAWLKPSEAISCAERAIASLEQTRRPSTPDAAARELDGIFSKVLGCSVFGALDQRFLLDVVFPFIRSGALGAQQHSRWSNGDFNPRNLLVNEHRHVRLVDYEFASRTHFFAEDWWRWNVFSKLPLEVRDLPKARGVLPSGNWLEALFILRQIAMEHAVNGAQIAVSDARQGIERIMAIVAAAHAGFRSSAFLRPQAPASLPASNSPGMTHAQLYWSSNGDFSEERTVHTDYRSNQEAPLTFSLRTTGGETHLRLDPSSTPGMLGITAVRISRADGNSPLLSLSNSADWAQVRLGSGLLRLADSGRLNLLSLDNDPYLYLPAFDAGKAPCDLQCEVWLSFTEQLTALPRLLDLQHSASPSAAALQAAQLQIAADNSARGQAEAELSGLSQKHEQALEELRNAIASSRSLQENLDLANKRTASIAHELESTRQELASRIAAVNALENASREAQARTGMEAAERAKAEAALADLAAEHQRALEQLAQATASTQALKESVRQAVERSSAQQFELERVRGELSSHVHRLAQMELAARDANASVAEALARASALSEQRDNLESELRASRQAQETALARVRDLDKEVTRLREEADRQAAEAGEKDLRLASLARDLAVRDKTILRLEEAQRESAQLIQLRTEEADRLQLMVTDLTLAVEKASALRTLLERDLGASQEHAAALSAEINEGLEKLKGEKELRRKEQGLFAMASREQEVLFEKEREELLLKLESCENDLRDARRNLAEAQEKLALSTSDADALRKSVGDFRTRLASLEATWPVRLARAINRKDDESKGR